MDHLRGGGRGRPSKTGQLLRPIGNDSDVDGKAKGVKMEVLMAKLLRSQQFTTFYNLVTMILVIGFGVALVVAGFAIQPSGQMLTRTGEDTHAMRAMTTKTNDDVTGYINSVRSNFPKGQDITTIRQGLAVVENVKAITSKVSVLLEHVTPETITIMVNHVGTIVTKVDTMMAAVSDAEVVRFQALLKHMHELIAGVTPQHISALMDGVSETAQHVGHMSKEAEESHLVEHSAQLFAEAKGTLSHFNNGQGISLGWGMQRAVPVIAPQQEGLPHPTP